MAWFKRDKQNIVTQEKKEVPDGLWLQCPTCKLTSDRKYLSEHYLVCPGTPNKPCQHHFRVGSAEYFSYLFDDNQFTELNAEFISSDPLHFVDTKAYTARIIKTRVETGLNDAMRTAYGTVNGLDLMVACMDFSFIGGSMGIVVGEKISKAIDHCIATHTPLLIISKSGGARMMEAAFSLMQMAKSSAKLVLLAQAKIPYISLMTDPTTGGVTASYAMLGDLNIAEPQALIGFAGPRVVKETIKKELPEGFQSAESVLETGFLDLIVPRKDLKQTLSTLLHQLKH